MLLNKLMLGDLTALLDKSFHNLFAEGNGGSRMGHLGQIPPPPSLHLVEEPAMLLIKTASKFYVRSTEISLKLMKICTFY